MTRFGLRAWVTAAVGAVPAAGIGHAQDGETPAPAQWTQAQLRKGYVVFGYNPREKLEASHVPTRRRF